MFIFGIVIGLAIGAVVAFLMHRKQGEQLSNLQRTSSSQFRRIATLENELAEAKTTSATDVRNAKLRNAREFSQYKTLLRRADTALSQAKAERARQAAPKQAA